MIATLSRIGGLPGWRPIRSSIVEKKKKNHSAKYGLIVHLRIMKDVCQKMHK